MVIGSSLSTIVLAGVLSVFITLARSGVNATNYSTAESEIRRAIETFSQDVRMANSVTYNSPTSITLTLPAPNRYNPPPAPPPPAVINPLDADRVTYEFNATTRQFVSTPGRASSVYPPLVLVRQISSFEFAFYNRTSETPLDPAAPNFSSQVKRVQIALNVRVTQPGTAAVNTPLAMASTILRNKPAN